MLLLRARRKLHPRPNTVREMSSSYDSIKASISMLNELYKIASLSLINYRHLASIELCRDTAKHATDLLKSSEVRNNKEITGKTRSTNSAKYCNPFIRMTNYFVWRATTPGRTTISLATRCNRATKNLYVLMSKHKIWAP